MNCPNCQETIAHNYCPHCGKAAKLPRINAQYIKNEIAAVLSLDKGLLLTIKELIVRPGPSIQTFLLTDRKRLVKPILFVIICSVLYTLAQRIFHFEDGYISYSDDTGGAAALIFEWVSSNYGYANIIMAFFIAAWAKLLFRKSEYNLFEILVMLLFVMGTSMLIFAISGLIDALTSINSFYIMFGGLSGVIYSTWAMGHFFNRSKVSSYIKSLLAYFLGFLSFSIVVIFIGLSIDYFLKG